MAEWQKQIGAINLIVGDLERSKAFYRDVFGLPLQHEDRGQRDIPLHSSSTKMTNCPTPFCARLSTSLDGPS